MSAAPNHGGGRQHIVVLRGRPDEAELAALITVLAALWATPQPSTEGPHPPPAPSWNRPASYRPAGAWTAR